jgi:hypothetical protein
MTFGLSLLSWQDTEGPGPLPSYGHPNARRALGRIAYTGRTFITEGRLLVSRVIP